VTNLGDLNGTTRFIWGGQTDWQCLEERDGDDDLVARYTYAPGYIDDVAVQERDLNADDDFAADDEVVYYMSNTLHNVYGTGLLVGCQGRHSLASTASTTGCPASRLQFLWLETLRSVPR
jgi:hypothetical protein